MGKRKIWVEGAESINVARRLYWSEEYGDGVITNLQDQFGDDTENEAEACFAVVRIHAACWISVDLSKFDWRSAAAH